MLWYVSPQKLDALSAEGGNVFDRVTGSAKVAVGVASFELGLQPGTTEKIEKVVRRLEKRLRKEGSVTDVEGLTGTEAVRFFEYSGPSARAVTGLGAFLVAAKCNDTAVMLAGSAANAIGAPLDLPRQAGSGDPHAAIASFFEKHERREALEELDSGKGRGVDDVSGLSPGGRGIWNIWVAWSDMMIGNTGGNLAALPHTRGIALYGGSHPTNELPYKTDKSISKVVVGSPIWVEQI